MGSIKYTPIITPDEFNSLRQHFSKIGDGPDCCPCVYADLVHKLVEDIVESDKISLWYGEESKIIARQKAS